MKQTPWSAMLVVSTLLISPSPSWRMGLRSRGPSRLTWPLSQAGSFTSPRVWPSLQRQGKSTPAMSGTWQQPGNTPGVSLISFAIIYLFYKSLIDFWHFVFCVWQSLTCELWSKRWYPGLSVSYNKPSSIAHTNSLLIPPLSRRCNWDVLPKQVLLCCLMVNVKNKIFTKLNQHRDVILTISECFRKESCLNKNNVYNI